MADDVDPEGVRNFMFNDDAEDDGTPIEDVGEDMRDWLDATDSEGDKEIGNVVEGDWTEWKWGVERKQWIARDE